MNKLQKDGYSRYDLMKSLNYEGIEQDYNEILAYFADLPEDDYALTLIDIEDTLEQSCYLAQKMFLASYH